MKLVEINSGFHGSTGTIMLDIAETLRTHGWEAHTFSAPKAAVAPNGHRYFGSIPENLLHRAVSVLSGISGKGSILGTRQLLKELERIQPDILHLHNLHGWFINLPMLFDYIRKNNIRTVWTLHDCWAFTAQCSYFTMESCEKWKTGCYSCPRLHLYPNSYVDRTQTMWGLKKQWFTGVEQLTIVTPSTWLAKLVKQSFLQQYPVRVINNGIDLSIFKPTKSDFRERYHLQHKKIVLGVANVWHYGKGLDILVDFAKRLGEDYQMVLVGTSDKIDKELPANIISIHRTYNKYELAEIYSAADVFVNPTREDNFPTVNLEALACGTPIASFDTGGSAEMLTPACGEAVTSGDSSALCRAVIELSEKKHMLSSVCARVAQNYGVKEAYQNYIKMYNEALAAKS